MADANEFRKKKGRSPSYPGTSLEVAVRRAQVLYDEERQHAVPMATVTSHWGFRSPSTGPASVAYAALKKFGLLEEEGHGATGWGGSRI